MNNKFGKKRKGSAVIITVLFGMIFLALIAANLTNMWSADLFSDRSAKVASQASIYCDDKAEELKAIRYSALPTDESDKVIASDPLYREVVKPLGDGKFQISVYYNGESYPVTTKIVERTEGGLNYDVLNEKIFSAEDGRLDKQSFSQKIADDIFASKSEYLSAELDADGNRVQVGNGKRPVYIKDGKPVPVDFIFRGSNVAVTGNTKVAVTDGYNIDYIYLNDMVSTGILEQNFSRDEGYVVFGNGMVLAYKNGYSAVSAGSLAEVNKPTEFTTYQAYGTDTSRGNEKTSSKIVWQAGKTSAVKDSFKLDTNGSEVIKEHFSVFWVGMK